MYKLEDINDDFIIEYCCFIKHGKMTTQMSWNRLKKRQEYDIINYLKHRYNDILETANASEIIYRILHKIETRPKCVVCGKPLSIVKFVSGYGVYCSNECKHSDKGNKLVWSKANQTIKDIYGVENIMNDPEYKKKCVRLSREKTFEKHGVYHNFQIPSVREQIKKTVKEKTGFEYAFLNRDKIKNTLHEQYGDNIDNVFQLDTVKQKIIATKHKNNTFTGSKPEDIIYEYLLGKYKDVLRQHKSKQYPYLVDFYIPEIDTYIELQGTWTHGGHPFDENNIEDINKYNYWVSKNTRYYIGAANNWRYRDVKKRNIAKENGLKFIEIFEKKPDEIKSILDKELTLL